MSTPETRQYISSRFTWTFALLEAIPGLDFNAIDLRPGLVKAPHASGGLADPDWALTTDDQGNAEYTFNEALNGQLAFTYQYGSITNTKLATLRQIDRITKLGIGTLEGKDANGSTVVVGRGARLQGPPTIELGQSAGPRVWTFLIAQLVIFAGGTEVIA
jgi:hypothetical protein